MECARAEVSGRSLWLGRDHLIIAILTHIILHVVSAISLPSVGQDELGGTADITWIHIGHGERLYLA